MLRAGSRSSSSSSSMADRGNAVDMLAVVDIGGVQVAADEGGVCGGVTSREKSVRFDDVIAFSME